jgi:cardiolipin synthase
VRVEGPAVHGLQAVFMENWVEETHSIPAGPGCFPVLKEAGSVKTYEFAPTLLHQKIVIVDGIWSHVGSTNFDSRSLALNEEVGIGVLDERIATELRAAFEADLRHSSELHLQAWRHRPVHSRAWSWLAYRLHAQL